jgi:hypothetical protein
MDKAKRFIVVPLSQHLVTRLPLARGGELELLIERISGRISDQVLPNKVSSVRLNNLARGNKWAARPTGGKIVAVLESKATLQHVLKTCWEKSGNLVRIICYVMKFWDYTPRLFRAIGVNWKDGWHYLRKFSFPQKRTAYYYHFVSSAP